jgi:exodeoxyribonuclease VII large subunit
LNKALRLSELTRNIQRTIEGSFADHTFWVIADVTNHTFKASSNVHYFDLVEKDPNSSAVFARMTARAWGTGSNKITSFERESGQRFENNINVLVLISVNFNSSFGLQLSLHDIDPTYTLGHFERERKATLDKLVERNPEFISRLGNEYATKNKRQPLNSIIQKIAVITSDTSAGYQDFVHALETNGLGYRFFIDDYFSLVQGESNASIMVSKLVEIHASGINYDAVVMIRGGGAQTDFLIYDNYQLARAIAKFPIPIITGIGHHKNETIADLMANTVTNTPTKAAEFVIAHNRQFEDLILQAQRQIIIKTQQIFAHQNRRLNSLKNDLLNDVYRLLSGHHRGLMNTAGSISVMPGLILSNKKKDLTAIENSISKGSKTLMAIQNDKLAQYSRLINMMSPQNILLKGFAIIKLNDKIISQSGRIEVGSEVQIQMATEELTATIQSKKTR